MKEKVDPVYAIVTKNGILTKPMYPRAENAYLALPNAIGSFEEGIRYSFDSGYVGQPLVKDYSGLQVEIDEDFKQFRIDLSYLIRFYRDLELFNLEQEKTLFAQLDGVDKEAWYLAFILLDEQRHKLLSSASLIAPKFQSTIIPSNHGTEKTTKSINSRS